MYIYRDLLLCMFKLINGSFCSVHTLVFVACIEIIQVLYIVISIDLQIHMYVNL